jgi:hypothetical protein
VHRRITDGFARLGSLTPGAGFAGARRSREPANWDQGGGPRPAASGDPRGDWDAATAGRKKRNAALVVGAGVLSVIAIAGVLLAPTLFKPSDPGCTAYAGPALTAYNKAIDDLNTRSSQSHLSADMSAAVTDLTKAAAQAQGAAVKSALNGLLTELKTIQGEVAAGAVPTSAVNALNAASTTADHAC